MNLRTFFKKIRVADESEGIINLVFEDEDAIYVVRKLTAEEYDWAKQNNLKAILSARFSNNDIEVKELAMAKPDLGINPLTAGIPEEKNRICLTNLPKKRKAAYDNERKIDANCNEIFIPDNVLFENSQSLLYDNEATPDFQENLETKPVEKITSQLSSEVGAFNFSPEFEEKFGAHPKMELTAQSCDEVLAEIENELDEGTKERREPNRLKRSNAALVTFFNSSETESTISCSNKKLKLF